MTSSDPKTKKPKKPSKPKVPKLSKPDEFFRTVFGRLSIRKLSFLYIGFGEADNEFILGSVVEDDLIYGSPTYAMGLVIIKDPVMCQKIQDLLTPFGYIKPSETKEPYILDLRDVSAVLNKFKTPDEYGLKKDEDTLQVWRMVSKKQKKEDGGKMVLEPKYVRDCVIGLFRFQSTAHWAELLKSFLTNTSGKGILSVPFDYEGDPNGLSYKVPEDVVRNSPLGTVYPCAIKSVLIRGLDFLDLKFLKKSDYPIGASDLIFWCESGQALRCAHVVTTKDFDIAIARPNTVFLPPR